VRPDQRSPEAAAYRKLYQTAEWRALRKAQLQCQPICERCRAKGFVVSATVVNHRKPHKGDANLFRDPTNLQSVCQPCHDGPIQAEEASGQENDRHGFSSAVSNDGFPTDPRHPFNRWHGWGYRRPMGASAETGPTQNARIHNSEHEFTWLGQDCRQLRQKRAAQP
jgi:hypothetical protein